MTRTFFFFFIPLCLLFSLHISSSICFVRCRILLQRILHRWGSIKLHLICLHASSRLLLLFFFFPLALSAAAADLRVGKLCWDFSGFHLTGGRHTEAPPTSPSSGGIRRNWFVLLCLPSLLLPPLSSSRPPPLLLSLPSLLGGGRREAGRYQHV